MRPLTTIVFCLPTLSCSLLTPSKFDSSFPILSSKTAQLIGAKNSRDSIFCKDHLFSKSHSRAVPFFAEEAEGDVDLSSRQNSETSTENNGATNSIPVDIQTSRDDKTSIHELSKFMIESFWLGSARNIFLGDNSSLTENKISEKARSSLINIQTDDLMEKYGERMGKRAMESRLLVARPTSSPSQLLAMVGIEMCLYDTSQNILLTSEASEGMLRNAVASLGPKLRREYKDVPLSKVVDSLLPTMMVVTCLSNLAVDPKSRKMGLGTKLCREAEKMAFSDWNTRKIVLKVEEDNIEARRLYENKLSYEQIANCSSDGSDSALRVDLKNGVFVEEKNIVIRVLSKDLLS